MTSSMFSSQVISSIFVASTFLKRFQSNCINWLGYLFANTLLAKLIKIILQPFARMSINSKIDTLIFQIQKYGRFY